MLLQINFPSECKIEKLVPTKNQSAEVNGILSTPVSLYWVTKIPKSIPIFNPTKVHFLQCVQTEKEIIYKLVILP